MCFFCHTRPGTLSRVSAADQPRSAVTAGAEGREGSYSFLGLPGNRKSRGKLRRKNGVSSSKISPLELSVLQSGEEAKPSTLTKRNVPTLFSVVISKLQQSSKSLPECYWYLLCKPWALSHVNFFKKLLTVGLKVGVARSRNSL